MTETTSSVKDQAAEEKPVYGNISADDLDTPEYTEDQFNDFMALYDESISGIKEGQIVNGRVVAITANEVMVDIGFKSEGIVSLREFSDADAIETGQEIEVFLESVEDQEGQVVLSKQKADFMRVWDHIKDAHDTGNTVQGRLQRRIKGGIVVDLFGVDAFLPGSQIDIRQVKNFDQFLGQEFPFKIIKLNKARRNIVVSRRAVLEEEREKMRVEIIKELEEGQIREGVVKNITDFGAFIDLGGVDGLLHITDMSWGRVSHPSELVSIGDRIKVKVLNYDRERERISLGLKQLTAHPWESIDNKYPVGVQVKGKVVSITDYGAFVELEEGIEGLVHISEMSWTQHIRHPSKLVTIGDPVEVVVLKADKENQKISLGMKQIEPDPWETLDTKYPIGMQLEGTVRSLTNFGAFVELEEGIAGLVHISDMSWTRRIRQSSEMFKKGDVIPAVVTEIDKKRRRVSLSHKMAFENPWPALTEKYAVGSQTTGTISRLLERGVVVSLEGELDGFVLSVRDYLRDKDQAEFEDYLNAHPIKSVTIGDVVADQDDEMESWGDSIDGKSSSGAPTPTDEAPADPAAEDEEDEDDYDDEDDD